MKITLEIDSKSMKDINMAEEMLDILKKQLLAEKQDSIEENFSKDIYYYSGNQGINASFESIPGSTEVMITSAQVKMNTAASCPEHILAERAKLTFEDGKLVAPLPAGPYSRSTALGIVTGSSISGDKMHLVKKGIK